MSEVRDLHNEAMDLAQMAVIARFENREKEAEKYTQMALDLEQKAAEQIPENKSSEPTRSILYRSSASLAYQCQNYDLAKRLIAKGLSGFPSPQIERELNELYNTINFEHHYSLIASNTGENDLHVSLHGDSVISGSILYDEFFLKIQFLKKIIDRTMQRVMGNPYQRAGRVSEQYKPFIPAISAATSGSYAFTIKLLYPIGKQMELIATPQIVINEILEGIDLINDSKEEKLKSLIDAEDYYTNFISLVKNIAPDGKRISLVGLASKKKTVSFKRTREEITSITTDITQNKAEESEVEYQGVVDYAIGRQKEIVGLTTTDGNKISFSVKAGLDDLVRSFWGQQVKIKGIFDGKSVLLTDMEPIE